MSSPLEPYGEPRGGGGGVRVRGRVRVREDVGIGKEGWGRG